MTKDQSDFVSALKKARMLFPAGKKGRLKLQWLSILAHSVHTQNHSPLDQIHAAFSPQFALQSVLLISLLVTFPIFLRHTQHK